MSETDRDVDELLRRNADRQLAGFDWNRQRQTVMQGLDAARARKPRRMVVIGVAAGVAAVLMLIAGYVCMGLLKDAGGNSTTPAETVAVREGVDNDPLLASTDPTTILLTGSMRLRVSNDPTLALRSVWDQ